MVEVPPLGAVWKMLNGVPFVLSRSVGQFAANANHAPPVSSVGSLLHDQAEFAPHHSTCQEVFHRTMWRPHRTLPRPGRPSFRRTAIPDCPKTQTRTTLPPQEQSRDRASGWPFGPVGPSSVE